MTCETTATGRISEPQLKFTKTGKPVLELNINATRSTQNKNTNQWEDDGEPLWIKAAFWNEEAENLAETLNKGDRITVTGTLIIRGYQKSDGTRGQSLELRYPHFLGIIPKKPLTHPSNAQTNDPWATAPSNPQKPDTIAQSAFNYDQPQNPPF